MKGAKCRSILRGKAWHSSGKKITGSTDSDKSHELFLLLFSLTLKPVSLKSLFFYFERNTAEAESFTFYTEDPKQVWFFTSTTQN